MNAALCRWITRLVLSFVAVAVLGSSSFGGGGKEGEAGKQQTANGPPPVLVVTASAVAGAAEPMAEFVGSVFFSRVSEVASEVEGIVEEAGFEEGFRVSPDAPLVKLRTDLLDIAIEGTRGTYEQVLVDLEKAEKDRARMEALFREQSVAETVYDEALFRERGLQKRAVALKADLDRLVLEREKKVIHAPFPGVVVRKIAEKGEWVATGGTVAAVADDGELDIVVDLPEDMLRLLGKGREVPVRAAGRELKGGFLSVVPRGDVASRTFSAKFRVKNAGSLLEGMEARVMLPSGPRREGILVPRDGLITTMGQTVVFAVVEGKAKMIPVVVEGYDGGLAAVTGAGIEAGTQVVVKGNERIRDGQPVTVKD